MASSNRHWPSLFKSKPRAAHLQGHHDHISSSALLAGACSQKPPYSSSGVLQGTEERTPEPKPRWNPKPEQIRILEAIFNSGVVNPPRDEIRRIRAQLQVYGQVGDANVFYWFQNRKSRSKQKQRHLQATRSHSRQAAAAAGPPRGASAAAANSSSSSSSERSTGSDKPTLPVGTSIAGVAAAGGGDASHSPTASVNQNLLQGNPSSLQGGLPAVDPLYLQSPPQGCYFSPAEPPGLVFLPEQAALGLCAGLLELPHQEGCKINGEEAGLGKIMHPGFGSAAAVATATAAFATTVAAATPLSVLSCESTVTGHVGDINQAGMGSVGGGAARSTVFINEVAFEVGGGLIDVKDAFGDAALLFNSSGLPVAVDERGVTLHPLQHGASYYLV